METTLRRIYSQNTLELGTRLWHKVQVRTVQISLERLVGSTPGRKGLVEGGVILVPAEPILANQGGKGLTLDGEDKEENAQKRT